MTDEKTNLNSEMISLEDRKFIDTYIRNGFSLQLETEDLNTRMYRLVITILMRHVLFLEEQQERIKVFIPENMLVRIDDQEDYEEKST